MFPDPYAKCGSRLEEGKLALIQGLVGRRNGEMNLAAHEVYDLENSIPKIIQRINFILRPNEKAKEFIELLREKLSHNAVARQRRTSRPRRNPPMPSRPLRVWPSTRRAWKAASPPLAAASTRCG